MWKGIPQVGKVCHMDGIFMTFPTWIMQNLPQENFTITKTIFLPEMGLMLTLNQANHSLISGATCPWVLWQRSSAVCTCKSENQLHLELHKKKKTDQGRWFLSSTLSSWDATWSTTSRSRSPNIRKTRIYLSKSRGGHRRNSSPVKTIHFAEQHSGERVHMLLPIPCPCC